MGELKKKMPLVKGNITAMYIGVIESIVCVELSKSVG